MGTRAAGIACKNGQYWIEAAMAAKNGVQGRALTSGSRGAEKRVPGGTFTSAYLKIIC